MALGILAFTITTIHFLESTMATCSLSSDLLTREEAAAYLGIKPGTLAVWRTRKRYNLPVVKVGSLVRYRRSDLEKFLDRRTVGDDTNNEDLLAADTKSMRHCIAGTGTSRKKIRGLAGTGARLG